MRNLFIYILAFIVLGMVSCNEAEDPTPMDDPTEEAVQFSDFDGVWKTVTTTYEGVSYDSTTVCFSGIASKIRWDKAHFIISTADNSIQYNDVCDDFIFNLNVTFDIENLIISHKTSTGYGDYREFQIVNYNLDSTPKTAKIKVIKDEAVSGYQGFPVGVVYDVVLVQ